MKITTLAVLISIWFLRVKLTNGNYRRIIRGPPQPPRPPHGSMQYMKKWSMAPHPPPHRPQMRPRPIPVKIPPSFKKPMGPPMPMPPTRHSMPMRNAWKSAQIFKAATEKPFLSSPKIALPEYDYHVQTNSIPTHANTIKQVGEKGPIHTIPAPNLSPADKPSSVETMKQIYQHQQILQFAPQQPAVVYQQHQQQQPQQSQQQNVIYQQPQQHQHTIVEIQKSHQYQVTEASEPVHQQLKLPTHQQVELKQVFFAPDPTVDGEINKIPSPSADHLSNLPRAEYLIAPQPEQAQTITPQELYKLLNLYPQQQLVDSYGLPIVQQPQLQQHLIRQQLPNYQQTVLNNPQFQSFNYDEQDQRNLQQANQISSRVVADLSVKGENENSASALAQSQYVQHYFDTRDEHGVDNDVEPDAQATNLENEIPKDAFYSTLPNRQAAETLASLQEAGKLNSNPQQEFGGKKKPIAIYVPDNYDDGSQEASVSETNEKASQGRGDYGEDDLQGEANESVHAQYQAESIYGSRVRTHNM